MPGENFRYVFKPRPNGRGPDRGRTAHAPAYRPGASGGGAPMGRRLPAGRDTGMNAPLKRTILAGADCLSVPGRRQPRCAPRSRRW